MLIILNKTSKPIWKIYSILFLFQNQFPANSGRPFLVSNGLIELSDRYVGTGLSHSIPLVVRLVEEYKEGFKSRYIEYPTPLCNCYLTISSFFPET
ncbi:hypothetical protein BpHYR1_006908 [Brachionus plicatilis]|uniref:Uncharacterized protein n=1 Tax=Brachionus plicatilis TaxID=10195 RepID=A0A3M7QRP7_BRAPC|nr:hypothetical protein BpHYR1_006908 [Brachionus plicatilis]